MVNQNFSQQILKKTGRKDMTLPNPFHDEEDETASEPASVAYRYRKFALDSKNTLVCRTELQCGLSIPQVCFGQQEYTRLPY